MLHPHRKEFLPGTSLKSILFQYKVIIPYPITVLHPACICAWNCPDSGAGSCLELHEVPTACLSSLWIPSLQCAGCVTQVAVGSKLFEEVLNLSVHVTNKDVKQLQSPHQPLRNATPVTGVYLDIEPLIPTLWVKRSSQFLIHQVVHTSDVSLIWRQGSQTDRSLRSLTTSQSYDMILWYIGLLRALSNLNLKTPRSGTSTVSPGNLCQCLTTPWMSEIFSSCYSSCGLEDAFLTTRIISHIKQDDVEVENFL